MVLHAGQWKPVEINRLVQNIFCDAVPRCIVQITKRYKVAKHH